jgi:phage baseplate assembly protein W
MEVRSAERKEVMADIQKAISLPFAIDPTGKVATTTSQPKIWADRIMAVLGTAVSERLNNYYFGSRIHLEVWQSQEQATFGLEREISAAFLNHLPLLTYRGVDVEYQETEGVLNITVKYSLPNEQEQTLTVGNVTISGNSVIKEN